MAVRLPEEKFDSMLEALKEQFGELSRLRKLECRIKKLGGIENIEASMRVCKNVYISPDFIVSDFFTIKVEKRSLRSAIRAGKYDVKNADVNDLNFPLLNEVYGKKEMFLLHFKEDLSSADIIKKMKKAGYRPATLMDLLSLAAKFPNFQRKTPIVALGSVTGDKGKMRAPVIYDSSGCHALGLSQYDEPARRLGYGFLAVLIK